MAASLEAELARIEAEAEKAKQEARAKFEKPLREKQAKLKNDLKALRKKQRQAQRDLEKKHDREIAAIEKQIADVASQLGEAPKPYRGKRGTSSQRPARSTGTRQRRGGRRTAIIGALGRGQKSVDEVVKATGMSKASVNVALSNLTKDGSIVRVSRGVYKVK